MEASEGNPSARKPSSQTPRTSSCACSEVAQRLIAGSRPIVTAAWRRAGPPCKLKLSLLVCFFLQDCRLQSCLSARAWHQQCPVLPQWRDPAPKQPTASLAPRADRRLPPLPLWPPARQGPPSPRSPHARPRVWRLGPHMCTRDSELLPLRALAISAERLGALDHLCARQQPYARGTRLRSPAPSP